MKFKEIKGLGSKELDDKHRELSKELLKVRGQIAVGTTPKSPGQVRSIRKAIAQILFLKGQAKAAPPQASPSATAKGGKGKKA